MAETTAIILKIFIDRGHFTTAWTLSLACKLTSSTWKNVCDKNRFNVNQNEPIERAMIRRTILELAVNSNIYSIANRWMQLVDRCKCKLQNKLLDDFIINADITIHILDWLRNRAAVFKIRHALILLNRGKFEEYNYLTPLFGVRCYDNRQKMPLVKRPRTGWPKPVNGAFWPSWQMEKIYAFVLAPIAPVRIRSINNSGIPYFMADDVNIWMRVLLMYTEGAPLSVFNVRIKRLKSIANRITHGHYSNMRTLISLAEDLF